jgi:hypothetical protein
MQRHGHLPHIKIHNLRVNPLKHQFLKFLKLLADHSLLFASPAHLPREIVAGANGDDTDGHFVYVYAVIDDLFDNPEHCAITPADDGPAGVSHRL